MHSASKLGGALLVTLVPAGWGGSSSSSSSDQTASFKTGFYSAAGQLKQGSHAIGVAIQQAPSQTDAQLAATFHQLASR
jgi:hypothetical protein